MFIGRTGSETCPVDMLEAHMQKGGIHFGSEAHLLRPIVSSKSDKLRHSPTVGCASSSRLS